MHWLLTMFCAGRATQPILSGSEAIRLKSNGAARQEQAEVREATGEQTGNQYLRVHQMLVDVIIYTIPLQNLFLHEVSVDLCMQLFVQFTKSSPSVLSICRSKYTPLFFVPL